MRIIIADDEKMILEDTASIVKKLKPNADVRSFNDPEELLSYIEKNKCDVAFLDIEMGYISGIEVAKKMKQYNPSVNIIFATGYKEYMENAIKLRASGYIVKPINEQEVLEELENLRTPVNEQVYARESINVDRLVVRCFGNFDVFYNGSQVKFERSKTRELLAYLVDRQGSTVTSGELCAVLWEDAKDDAKTGHYLQILKRDLITTLKKIRMEKVFIHSRNSYAINADMLSCDYYDYISGKPEGVRLFNGEYMSQYSWAEDKIKK